MKILRIRQVEKMQNQKNELKLKIEKTLKFKILRNRKKKDKSKFK